MTIAHPTLVLVAYSTLLVFSMLTGAYVERLLQRKNRRDSFFAMKVVVDVAMELQKENEELKQQAKVYADDLQMWKELAERGLKVARETNETNEQLKNIIEEVQDA